MVVVTEALDARSMSPGDHRPVVDRLVRPPVEEDHAAAGEHRDDGHVDVRDGREQQHVLRAHQLGHLRLDLLVQHRAAEQSRPARMRGKVVVIEETDENEYFKDRRIQVSIFMSPLNVHENRYPASGKIVYYQYHEGDYLVAWHPKSSTHNERTTIVLKATNGIELLVRQIAGAVARRVVCYSKVNNTVVQGETLGFIKFGSRVDLFLPLDVKLDIELNQKVTANKTIIGHW